MSQLNLHLKSVLDDCVAEVTGRRMFGSDALFANGNSFARVWDGRIALERRDPPANAQTGARDGAAPWNPMGPGRAGMTHWGLLSEALTDAAARAHRDNRPATQAATQATRRRP